MRSEGWLNKAPDQKKKEPLVPSQSLIQRYISNQKITGPTCIPLYSVILLCLRIVYKQGSRNPTVRLETLQKQRPTKMTPVPKVQRAFTFNPENNKLEYLENYRVQSLKPHQGLLKIKAAGLCHSDLTILKGGFPASQRYAMGHEICGELVQTYADEPKYAVGKLYTVVGNAPCGGCDSCKKGWESCCTANGEKACGLGQCYGIGRDGGYAEYIAVDLRHLVKVPKELVNKPEICAVATDAVLTPYHAIKNIPGFAKTPDYCTLVIGLGGLGLNGMQVANALGSRVICADFKDSQLQKATEMGAEQVFKQLPTDASLGVDAVVDFVGHTSTIASAMFHLKPHGFLALVGISAAGYEIGFPALSYMLGKEISMIYSFWGTTSDQEEVLDLIAAGKVMPHVTSYSLFTDLPSKIEEMREGKLNDRAAFLP